MQDGDITEADSEELFNTGVLRSDLAELGEREVRNRLNCQVYGKPGSASFAAVSAWIADAEFARLQEDSAIRDAREEATLLIAKRANTIAIVANIIAVIAIIIAIVYKSK